MESCNSFKYKVLFVCLGNICRSPAAQGAFQAIVDKNNAADRFYVDSAASYSGSYLGARLMYKKKAA